MLIKVVVLNRFLHCANNFLNRNFLAFNYYWFCFRVVRCFHKKYINGAILVYHDELIWGFLFTERFKPFHNLDSAFLLTRWFLVIIFCDFAFTHKKRIENIKVALATTHYALQLWLVSLFFVLLRFWEKKREIISGWILCKLQSFFDERHIAPVFENLLEFSLVVPVVNENVVWVSPSKDNQTIVSFLAPRYFLLSFWINLLGPNNCSAFFEVSIRHFVSYKSERTNTVNTVHLLVLVVD